jgi:hypothetical protein
MTDNVNTLDITVETCNRADLVFWRQHSSQIMTTLYTSVVHPYNNNTRFTYDATLATMLLLFVEVCTSCCVRVSLTIPLLQLGCCDDALVDLIRMILTIQSLANESSSKTRLTIVHRARLHCLCARFMHTIQQLCDVPALQTHVKYVCSIMIGLLLFVIVIADLSTT